MLSEATTLNTCPLTGRLKASLMWTSISRQHQHGTAMEAYVTALELLHASVAISRTLGSRYMNLSTDSRHQSLGPDAASLAIANGDIIRAVELLEQGRSILFTQLGQYRAPIDDLREVDPILADQFTTLSAQLNMYALSSAENSGLGSSGTPTQSTEDTIARCVEMLLEIWLMMSNLYLILGAFLFAVLDIKNSQTSGMLLLIIFDKPRASRHFCDQSHFSSFSNPQSMAQS
jgi:hypothetical protein